MLENIGSLKSIAKSRNLWRKVCGFATHAVGKLPTYALIELDIFDLCHHKRQPENLNPVFRLKPLQNLNNSLKSKTKRRQFTAKYLIKQSVTDLSKCRRVADVPLVVGFAKVSGCLSIIQAYPSTSNTTGK